MSEPIGSVYVDVRPRADDFVASLRARIVPEIAKLGDDAGAEFARQFSRRVADEVPDAFRRSRQRSNEQSRRSGKEAGDAFGRELDARIGAAIKALPDIEINAETRDAEAKLAIIRQQLADLHRQDIGFDLHDSQALALLDRLRVDLDELTGPEHDVRVRIDAKTAAAELAKIKAEVDALDENDSGGGKKKLDEARKSAGLLQLAIVGIGPAIIPVAAEGVAALDAFGGAAVTAGLAVKGVNDEIKAGTPLGQQWQGVLRSLSGDLTILETTASRSFLASAKDGAGDLQRQVGGVASEVQEIGRLSGDAAEHGIGAMLAAFHALDPLIEQFLADVDRGAQKLEGWAAGGGLNGFVAWAKANLPDVEHDLLQIGKFVAAFLAAEAPQGVTILNVLGETAHLGTEVLHVLGPLAPIATDVYLAFQLYAKLGAATASLRAFAAAQAEAAAASGGAAGARAGLATGAAGLLSRVAPYAAVLVGADLAVTQLEKSTRGWANSNNDLARSVHTTFLAFSDLGHLNFSGFGKNLIGLGAEKDYQRVRDEIETIKGLYRTLDTEGRAKNILGAGRASSLGLTKDLDVYQTERAKAYADTVNQVTSAERALAVQIRSTPVSQSAEAWNQLQTSIQANVDQVDKFLTLGGNTVRTINGIAIGENTWRAALEQSNGDKDHALALLDGLTNGISHNRHEINLLIGDQERIGQYQTDLTTKWGLSTDQLDLYTSALGLNAAQIARSPGSLYLAEQAMGGFVTQLRNGNSATDQWIAEVDAFNKSGDTLASRAQLVGAALVAANGDMLAYAGAVSAGAQAGYSLIDAFTQQADQIAQQDAATTRAANNVASADGRVAAAEAKLNQVRGNAKSTHAQVVAAEQQLESARSSAANAAITNAGKMGLAFADTERAAIDLKTGIIDLNAKGAGPLIQQLQGIQTAAGAAAAATLQHEYATKGAKQAEEDAYKVYVSQTQGFLEDQHDKLGISADAAHKLAEEYFGLKNAGDIKKQIEFIAQDHNVGQAIGNLTTAIGGFGDKVSSAFTILATSLTGAQGGLSLVNAQLDLLRANSAITFTAIGTGSSGGGGATGARRIAAGGLFVAKYAAGGLENHQPFIYPASPPGLVRQFAEAETMGESYIPLANDWRRPRARAIAAETVRRLGGEASFDTHVTVHDTRRAPAAGTVIVNNTWNSAPSGHTLPSPAELRRRSQKLKG